MMHLIASAHICGIRATLNPYFLCFLLLVLTPELVRSAACKMSTQDTGTSNYRVCI